MKSIYIFFAFVISFSFLNAQNFVVNNVTLFDGETIIKNTSVLVENGIITKIAPNISNKVQQIDGSGKFLMPAMTNSHVHAWGAPSLIEAAKAGVVNLLDMHGMEQFQPMLRNLKDSTNYARYFYAGSAATAPEGHGTQFGFPAPTLTTIEEADGFINDRLKAGAHYIKIIVEPWKATLSHEVVKALIEAAHAKETNVVVHISKVEDARQVLQNGADGLVHIWWDKEMDSGKLKELAAARSQFIIPTLLTSQLALADIRARSPESSFLGDDDLLSEVMKAYEAGIPILAGTDPPNVNINYGTDLYKELQLLSKAGIPNLDVLKSATSLPAKFFRLGKTGNIKEGYMADMILLNGNPINDIQHISKIETVWKEGKEVTRE